MRIEDYLQKGHGNAIHRHELVDMMGSTREEVEAEISTARRMGAPIIETNSTNPAYWLAETRQEMQAFINYLAECERQTAKLRKDCLRTLKNLEEENS